MTRAKLDFDRFASILWEGFGHLTVQNEGSVGVEFFLELEDLLVLFSPWSRLIHGKNEQVAAVKSLVDCSKEVELTKVDSLKIRGIK